MSKIVNKVDLAKDVADIVDLPNTVIKKVIDSIYEVIKKNLVDGSQISISGFGNFVVKNRAARTGRNPRTGEAISIKAVRAVVFKPSILLKRALQHNEDT